MLKVLRVAPLIGGRYFTENAIFFDIYAFFTSYTAHIIHIIGLVSIAFSAAGVGRTVFSR